MFGLVRIISRIGQDRHPVAFINELFSDLLGVSGGTANLWRIDAADQQYLHLHILSAFDPGAKRRRGHRPLLEKVVLIAGSFSSSVFCPLESDCSRAKSDKRWWHLVEDVILHGGLDDRFVELVERTPVLTCPLRHAHHPDCLNPSAFIVPCNFADVLIELFEHDDTPFRYRKGHQDQCPNMYSIPFLTLCQIFSCAYLRQLNSSHISRSQACGHFL